MGPPTDQKPTRPDLDAIARYASPSAAEIRRAWRTPGRIAAVVLFVAGVTVAIVFGLIAIGSAGQQISDLTAQQSSAARAAQALHSQVVALGAKPVTVAPTPVEGPAGATGASGPSGRGITGTQVVAGDLLVTYSDGNTQNVGPVVGPTGAPGRGIAAVSVASGDLVITYTDGTSSDLGTVVGPMGLQGVAGPTGSPGTNGTDGANGTDGTNGADGATGAQGPTGATGPPPQSWTWTDELGVTYTCTLTDPSTDAYTCTAN